ncbi:hypothetical protein HJG43_12485 [Kineosporiaceae bacterium SCSIO 59966]|nr:hypothetical protein HJG43_12485 [Kineosporiaceae bacterium SCSIO 59966]
MQSAEEQADPAVVEAVIAVRDRFGVNGLRDMIRLAEAELATAQEAVRRLGELTRPDAGPDDDRTP